MQCVGEWKEGTTRYLVVRAADGRKKIGSDKFKCLAYNMPGMSSSSGAEHDDSMGPSVLMMRRRGVVGGAVLGSAGSGSGSPYASTTVTDDGLLSVDDDHDGGLIDLAADVEMSISDGATCNGLISASEGAQILRLVRGMMCARQYTVEEKKSSVHLTRERLPRLFLVYSMTTIGSEVSK
jgi:hypothetical protein